MYVFVCMCICLCICICKCICMYICVYVCILTIRCKEFALFQPFGRRRKNFKYLGPNFGGHKQGQSKYHRNTTKNISKTGVKPSSLDIFQILSIGEFRGPGNTDKNGACCEAGFQTVHSIFGTFWRILLPFWCLANRMFLSPWHGKTTSCNILKTA